ACSVHIIKNELEFLKNLFVLEILGYVVEVELHLIIYLIVIIIIFLTVIGRLISIDVFQYSMCWIAFEGDSHFFQFYIGALKFKNYYLFPVKINLLLLHGIAQKTAN